MEKTLGKEYADLAARERYLKDNCDKVENKGYMKKFSPDELLGMKEELSETDISLNDVETELKYAKADFKLRIDPLKERRGQLLNFLKEKAQYVNEKCYKFIVADERMACFYNAEGDLVDARAATADEMQPNMFRINAKTGTDD